MSFPHDSFFLFGTPARKACVAPPIPSHFPPGQRPLRTRHALLAKSLVQPVRRPQICLPVSRPISFINFPCRKWWVFVDGPCDGLSLRWIALLVPFSSPFRAAVGTSFAIPLPTDPEFQSQDAITLEQRLRALLRSKRGTLDHHLVRDRCVLVLGFQVELGPTKTVIQSFVLRPWRRRAESQFSLALSSLSPVSLAWA